MRHPSGAGTGQQHPEEEMLFVPRSQFLLPEHHNSDFPYLFYPTPRSRGAQWCTEESSDQGREARKSALLGQRNLCAFLPGPFQIPVQERAGQAPEGLVGRLQGNTWVCFSWKQLCCHLSTAHRGHLCSTRLLVAPVPMGGDFLSISRPWSVQESCWKARAELHLRQGIHFS